MKVNRLLLSMRLVNLSRSCKDDEDWAEQLARVIESGDLFEKENEDAK